MVCTASMCLNIPESNDLRVATQPQVLCCVHQKSVASCCIQKLGMGQKLLLSYYHIGGINNYHITNSYYIISFTSNYIYVDPIATNCITIFGDQHPLASYDLGYHLRAPHIMVGEGKSSPNGVEIIERFRLSKDNSRRFLRNHPNCTPHSWDKFQHILHDHPTNRKWLISPRS